jgi:hypothetical protein
MDITTPKKPAGAGKANTFRKEAKAKTAKPSRLNQLQQLITRESGASIAEMVDATGWQPHSVRGAMAGALRKRGLAITSGKVDGVRRYQAAKSA